MANVRAGQLGLSGSCAVVGNALDLSQFVDGVLATIAAIGAPHNTGDFRRTIREVARVTSAWCIQLFRCATVFSVPA